jgi:hypothetical protein
LEGKIKGSSGDARNYLLNSLVLVEGGNERWRKFYCFSKQKQKEVKN